MGAFEVKDTTVETEQTFRDETEAFDCGGNNKIKDECIVAHKVYDSCRRQNCLTEKELGPARAEENFDSEGSRQTKAGEIIHPPANAVSVAMDSVRVKRITVVDKQPSPFRSGFWDVDIKFDISYNLTFREADGKIGKPIKAMNVFSVKTTLFGSVSNDLAVATDMYKLPPELSAAPYCWVEAKCLALDSRISKGHCDKEVHVIIGLFSIIKLFRLVHLNVQSKGFCIPNKCKDQGKINPCEYFDDLEFPVDIFAPPHKKDFLERAK
ncbi:MAG: hypothetical protein FWD19_06565 [Defluviitaleaceae bacterium]|nr:hypothetical protein [Defluviitaleaceae bacterium]